MKRELLAGLLLLAMAGGLYLRNISIEPPVVDSLSESEPDYVAREMKTRSYDANGRLNAEIAADTMFHYQQKQLTEFENPVYLVYPEDGNTVWKVKAKVGELRDNRFLTLEHSVIVEAIEPYKPIRTIHTEQLNLDLSTMEMETDRQLQAFGEQFQMTGLGLWADLKQNHIILKQKVSATYETQ
ncbi:LPS export ABC transporter periplasmic protein LptC [Ferrimonas lipolytica]|uniref:Lipopolysaccharide export system protein LptC n=1 Tax=Ferrimonas lipolytica TaxID=2724191 RepID=A0A6H1UGY2_9GAMM|nr:LPS export ABC transporter periplasmic protein LptC [Ferrimonas lipolytica]QIZ77889.1 LPS export ABC transporter periplasmic protein LptC [Ferrimonas lipolytica]